MYCSFNSPAPQECKAVSHTENCLNDSVCWAFCQESKLTAWSTCIQYLYSLAILAMYVQCLHTIYLVSCVLIDMYLMQVYTRLNYLGICTSYQHSLRLLDQFGEDHDRDVHNWSQTLQLKILCSEVCHKWQHFN